MTDTHFGDHAQVGVVGTAVNTTIQQGLNEADVRKMLEELLPKQSPSDLLIRQFLATLREQDCLPERWPEKLGEIASNYLQLQQRLAESEALAIGSQQVEQLLEQARLALNDGNFPATERLLDTAITLSEQEERDALGNLLKRQRQTASVIAAKGYAELSQLRHEAGARLLAQAAAKLAEQPDGQVLLWWQSAADAWLTTGNSGAALKAWFSFQHMLQILTQQEPDNLNWKHGFPISYTNIGDIYMVQGAIKDALHAYTAALKISQQIVSLAPNNSELQRNISISHNNIGDIYLEQGKLDDALDAYLTSLRISQELATHESNKTELLRDLSVIYDNIGEVYQKKQQLTDAYTAHSRALEISQQLARCDSFNTEWQRDLSISYNKIGNIQKEQGLRRGAIESCQKSLEIAERLTSIDPGNTEWQRDLLVSYRKIGDLQEQPDTALYYYRRCLEISQRLASLDPSNAGWQLDFAVSCLRVAAVMSKLNANIQERAHLIAQGLEISIHFEQTDTLPYDHKHLPELFRQLQSEL